MLEQLEIHQQMFRYYRLRDEFARRRQTHKFTPGPSDPGVPARNDEPPAERRTVEPTTTQRFRHG